MSLAFVFPGQGSQDVGMLAPLAEAYPIVRDIYASGSEVLGYDLWELVQHGPDEVLNRTDHTQPAMLAAGVAVWRVWQQRGGARPCVMAGHSLGEYTALVCAGALDFSTAIGVVEKRGRYMQEAVPAGMGAMAAILGLADEQVRAACVAAAQGQVVEAVNFNSPGQVVVGGDAAAVARAVEYAKAAGAKRAVVLPVSVPSHCALMRPAAERLAVLLDSVEIRRSQIPVINNVDVERYTDPAAIRDALVRQLYYPVRWVETVRCMAAEGVSQVVECGPGKVLAGLNKRTARDMVTWPVYDTTTLDVAIQALGHN